MEPIKLKKFDNYFTANILLSRMQAAGIDCFLMDENNVMPIPFLTRLEGGIKLVVAGAQAEEARNLLQQFEDEYKATLTCPRCGNKGMETIQKEVVAEKSTSIIGRLADSYAMDSVVMYKCENCGFETETLPEQDNNELLQNQESSNSTVIKPELRKIALIPARYASTRFPYKLMQTLGDKSVIRHTYDNTSATGLFDDVFVVTDSEIIFSEITNHGGKAIMSTHTHESGSDRIAEAVQDMDADIILNVQGDEPFVNQTALAALLQCFDNDAVQLASLMKPLVHEPFIKDPNIVKVVVDENNDSLYFSRSPIPHYRDGDVEQKYFEHIGVYAFRKKALLQFTKWPVGKLEAIEKLEQLRYLEHGLKIRMVETNQSSVKIDVPEDLARAQEYLNQLNNTIC